MRESDIDRFVAVRRPDGKARRTSAGTEAALLRGTHPLGSGIRLLPYVLGARRPIARCALALPADPPATPYFPPAALGFFECPDDPSLAGELFDWASQTALAHGHTELTGPVDGSFWLKYRMKLDHFEDPYVGEPDNPPYYPTLWAGAGFIQSHRYSSCLYPVPGPDERVARYDERRDAAVGGGVRIEPLTRGGWDAVLPAVYGLTMRLYARLPLYHALSLDQFVALFGPLKRVADPDLVTLAYRGDDLVGYSLVLPDFGDRLDRRMGPLGLLRLAYTRAHPKRIVSLYMGAAEPRLGSVMTARIVDLARARGCPIVGSLMIEGGVSELLGAEYVQQRRTYALWHRTA